MNRLIPQLSVILPVHNEEEGIENFLSTLVELLKIKKINAELLCVENGSSDRSFEILKSLEKKYKEIKILKSKKGWGNAVRKGISFAKGDYIAYMVTDWQVDPKHLISIYEKILVDGSDMVKITRITRENVKRLVNSRTYNYLAKMMFGFETMDINGTPKIAKREVFEKIPLSSPNITLDIELLMKMKKRNYKWIGIPVRSKKRKHGASTTNLKSVKEMFVYMVKTFPKYRF